MEKARACTINRAVALPILLLGGGRSTGVYEAILLRHMLLFGVSASNYAPFLGSNMLQRGDYAREICYFAVVHASPFSLQPVCIIYFPFPA